MKSSFKKAGLEAATALVGPLVAALRSAAEGIEKPITLRQFVNDIPRGRKLELGPLDRPQLQGANVEYFDVMGTAELRDYAMAHGRDPRGVPHIHHVSPVGDLRIVEGPYTAIFSSHMAEHHPDIISHFNIAADLLEDNGAYYIVLPDRRVTFDYFRPESTFADALARKGCTRSSAEAISQMSTMLAHNSQMKHWFGMHGEQRSNPGAETDQLARLADGDYLDAHNWVFTPASFLKLADELYHAGETRLKPERVHDTIFPSADIMAVLRKC